MDLQPASEHEALLQFLYLAPVGLMQMGPTGEIHFINPLSATLLMPLSRDGGLDNLFVVFEHVAPELRNLCEAFTAPSGQVCDGHRVQVTAGVPGKEDPTILAISIVKLDPERTMAVLSDVTMIAKRERLLRQSEAWFNAIVTGVEDYALMTLDAAGCIVQWNESIGRLTGLPEDSTRGLPYSVFYPDGAINPDRMADRLRQADDDGWSLDDGWRLRADGRRFWGSVMIAPLEPSEPGPTGDRSAFVNEGCYALILRDISDKRHAAEQQRLASSADHLTGLFNRRAFFEAAELEIERGKRVPRRISLLMIDADRFKSINDAHGHGVGDAVLRDLANVIASTVREIDTAARVGGEEFAVLLPSTDLAGAAGVASRLCESTRQRVVQVGDVSVRYTVSVGVSTMPPEMTGLDWLMKQADDALYQAKRSGRDRVAVSDEAGHWAKCSPGPDAAAGGRPA